MRSHRPVDRLAIAIGAAVVVLALAIYIATAARDLVFGDSPELIAVAATLGVAHPPGYPLWTVIAHLFSLLPVGPIPFRVGLVSVVCGTACVGVVYAIALRLSRSVPASAVAGFALAVQPLFWQWSIVPEVFALHALLSAVVIYCMLRWADAVASWRWLAGAALATGLGLANQQTIVLLAPAVLYLLWRHRRTLTREPSIPLKAAAALLIGLLPYGYLPLAASRDPVWSFGDLSSIDDVIGHVLRAQYGSGQLIVTPSLQGGSILDRLWALGSSSRLLDAALIVLGLVRLRRAEAFGFFIVALGVTGPLFIAYANADASIPLTRAVLERFFILPYVIGAPLVAPGIQTAAALLRQAVRGASPRIAETGVAAVTGVIALALAMAIWPTIDRSADHAARDFASDILASAPNGALLVVAGDAAAFPVEYVHTVEGTRPDVSIVHQTYLPADWYVRQLRRHDPTSGLTRVPASFREFLDVTARRDVYLAGDLLDGSTAGRYRGDPRGLLELVVSSVTPADPDADARETDRLFGAYHLPDRSGLKGRAFETIVANDYGLALVRVGQGFEGAKRLADARPWYERALRVVPDLPEAKAALARLK